MCEIVQVNSAARTCRRSSTNYSTDKAFIQSYEDTEVDVHTHNLKINRNNKP